MKSIPQFAFAMLIATLMLAAFPTDAEADIYEKGKEKTCKGGI